MAGDMEIYGVRYWIISAISSVPVPDDMRKDGCTSSAR